MIASETNLRQIQNYIEVSIVDHCTPFNNEKNSPIYHIVSYKSSKMTNGEEFIYEKT